MKLRTLKDLEEDPRVMQHCNYVVSSLNLKQEAIKRCKYYRDRRDRHKESKCWFWIHHRLFQEFRDFFNLTEEDLIELKGGKKENGQ